MKTKETEGSIQKIKVKYVINLIARHKTTDINLYGFYTGRSYHVQYEPFPAFRDDINDPQVKHYSCIKRAKQAADACLDRYGYVEDYEIYRLTPGSEKELVFSTEESANAYPEKRFAEEALRDETIQEQHFPADELMEKLGSELQKARNLAEELEHTNQTVQQLLKQLLPGLVSMEQLEQIEHHIKGILEDMAAVVERYKKIGGQ